ncbi:Alpha-ketoglutarate-dependent dioxygenase alkB -like protein 6 [Collichthys lucidus]|uniref:Alpha-ketoglutarate-dependent dioxygenase alkB-like protein 6 n=1 Tax=Collichthys lucidus TaxID=240159 RepID=A0A4U5U196_COLLU|nr:Alpha-ketoglutarate-dependent dioxygenase alkB -like protein 6 [Collichthys lucidus]
MEQPAFILEELKQFVINDAPPTVYYIPEFISADEESHLLQQVYKSPKTKWTQLSGRRLQNWGGLPHPKGMLAEKIPDWLQVYCEKISSLGAFSGKTANHVLGSHTLLDFYTPISRLDGDAPQTEESRFLLSLLVKPRSLLILQDEMYQRLLHGIQPCDQDTLTDKVVNLSAAGALLGETLTRDTRVSLTIRHVPKVMKAKLILGRK